MEVIFVVLLFFLQCIEPVLIVIGLIWALFAARRVYREIKSLRASRGDEAAMSMEKNRIKASILKIIAVILLPAVAVTTAVIGLPEWLAGILTVVCSGAFFAWSALTKARYAADFKENFVQAELSKVFDNLQYTPDGKFDAESIAGLGFFAIADAVGGNDLIIADYKGLRFSQCDLGVMEKYYVTVEDRDGDTRRETRYRDVFRGRAMRFDFADPSTRSLNCRTASGREPLRTRCSFRRWVISSSGDFLSSSRRWPRSKGSSCQLSRSRCIFFF